MADYLRSLISLDGHSMIGPRRLFYVERYARLLVAKTLNHFHQLHQDLETEFVLWTFMQHLDLVRKMVDRSFVVRHTLAMQSMLPQKKADRLFLRTLANQEQRLLFDGMLNNKFEDIKRLLKSNSEHLSEEEGFHLFNFFRIKLPEIFNEHKKSVLLLLQGHPDPDFPLPFLEDFVRDLLQSEFFLNWLQGRPENLRNQEYRQFLREKASTASPEMDQILAVSLSAMDLFHEKASLFEPEQRQLLTHLLTFVQNLSGYMTEAVFQRESFMMALEENVTERVRVLYQLEANILRPLYDELQGAHTRSTQTQQFLHAQAKQTGKAISALDGFADLEQHQAHFQYLNNLYTKHMGEITQGFHKRQETLEKLKSPEFANKRKGYFLKKLDSCLRFIPRAKREHKPVVVKYHKIPEAILLSEQESALGNFIAENDYEKLICLRAFEKGRNILNGLHQSKGTVKLNLRQLFGEALSKERCFVLFQEALAELWQVASAHPDETSDFLLHQFEIYLKGLGLPEYPSRSGLSAFERTGYILAYLAQSEHIKLLVEVKYHQLIYDWEALFNLSHFLLMLDSRLRNSQASFEDHFCNTLDQAWDCLTHYCLFAGPGQYNQLANPLTLFDYSYAEALDEYGSPPLTLTLLDSPDDDISDFGLLHLEAPAAQAALPTARSPKSPQALVPWQENTPAAPEPAAAYADDDDDDYGSPVLRRGPAAPAAGVPGGVTPGRRLIPPAPASGKVEIYTAPSRRAMPGAGQIMMPDEDDFYKVMSGQTVNVPPATPAASPPPPAPPAPPPPPVAGAGETPFYRSRGAMAAEPEPPVPAAKSKPKREPWLELTPQPHKAENYDDIMDHILTRSQGPGGASSAPAPAKAPDPTNDGDYNQLVEDILRRNRFDPNARVSSGETISTHNQEEIKQNKKRPGFS